MVALPIYGGPLKGDIVRRAYGLCGQSATVFDLDPEDMYTGLLALDDSMAMLGPLSGYNAPYSGVSSSEDESGIAAGDVMGVTVMTARTLATAIGKTLALSAIQARAESGLLAKCNPPPQMGLGRNTIAGAGNRYYRWWGPFLPTALDTVLTDAATAATATVLPAITPAPAPTPTPSPSPTPTPTPAPVATFSKQPAISGTPQVGSVAAFDPGVVTNGNVGTIRLIKDGADYADGSALSFQWTATGSYVLRVTIAGTSISADSPAVTVTAAPVTAVPAPSIALATTNADGSAYTAGTNPPRVVLTIPQTLDKTAYQALLYFDQATSGAIATDAAHTLTISDLMAAGDAEAATFSAFGSLAAGNFRAQAVFQNKSDNSFSPLSTVLTTTLNAKAQAAATTTFDPTNKSQYAVVSSDYRSFTGNPSDGRFASAAFSATRSDARYWEMTVTAVDASTNGSDYTGGGIVPVGTAMPQSGVPSAGAAYAGNSGYPVGTVYSFEAIPATSGNSDGSFKVWINGSLQATKSHSLTSYLPYALCYRDDTLKLNAGQEEFAYTNLSTAQRYN